MESQSASSRTFESFPSLPFELRAQIWTWVGRDQRRSRVIPLNYVSRTLQWEAIIYRCGRLVPMAHVCQESREQALTHYTSAFGTFIDFEKDFILIGDAKFSISDAIDAFLSCNQAHLVKNLAFSSEVFARLPDRGTPKENGTMHVLRSLPLVTHFVVVIGGDSRFTAIQHIDYVSRLTAWPAQSPDFLRPLTPPIGSIRFIDPGNVSYIRYERNGTAQMLQQYCAASKELDPNWVCPELNVASIVGEGSIEHDGMMLVSLGG